MNKEARKAAAAMLLQRCMDSGINFPRTRTAAEHLIECGTVLLANRSGNELDADAAFEQLKDKYGVVETAEAKSTHLNTQTSNDHQYKDDGEDALHISVEKPTRKRKSRSAAQSGTESTAESKVNGDGVDETGKETKKNKKKKVAAAKKTQAKISEQAVVEENKQLALAFYQLSRESFRVAERMPGMAYAKVAKIIREFPEAIRDAQQLKGIKGVGKASIEKIGEFLENGFISKLEELRATA